MPRDVPTHLLHAACTDRIIGSFYRVYNEMGPGLAERAYERALLLELQRTGSRAVAQRPLNMVYGSSRRVRFRADLVVDGKVLVEIKARSCLLDGHWAQLLHYLRISRLEVGLLLNFGPRPEFKRLVLSQLNRHGSPAG